MIRLGQPAFIEKIKGFVQQGATPSALALSATTGLLLGIFPVVGVTTLLMSGLALRCRLNLPLMLGLSYLIYPLQIFLIIPFVRLGEYVSGSRPSGLSLAALKAAFSKNFTAALIDLGAANLLAVVGWIVVAVPAGALTYLLLVPFFRKMQAVLKRLRPMGDEPSVEDRISDQG